jgi:hypothetical protein
MVEADDYQDDKMEEECWEGENVEKKAKTEVNVKPIIDERRSITKTKACRATCPFSDSRQQSY